MVAVSFLAVIVFSLVNGAWILRRLQKNHHAAWLNLGRPTVALRTGVVPRLALLNYIWSLRFRRLNDPQLTLACWAAITAESVLIVLFTLMAIGIN